ncbi:MAG: glycosyl transferase, partial [Ramlibacter sp.]|nr:glycosyl transferase [Ramlibacter sp.]
RPGADGAPPVIRWLDKRPGRLAALLLAAAWLAATAWVRPLMVPDEGRYASVAWEMLRSGDWLVPTLNGLPYFHKPPLFYWITSASLWLFGAHEWAARAAPLVGALMGASSLYLFARRWSGASAARLSLLVLATQPMFFLGAQFANLDMLVAGCIAATILASAHAALLARQGMRSRPALAAAWLFAALGLLAKGLIGLVLPGMVVVIWLLVLRRPRLIASLLWLPGMALFACVAGPWFIAMQWRFPEFGHYFFVVQHFNRFAQAGFNNAQPFWFYLPVIALLTLPWFVWLRGAVSRPYWSDPQQGPVRQLMWIWLIVVTGFFSLPQSKLVGYILPVTVPLAFLIGESAGLRIAISERARQWWKASAAIAIAACLAAVVLAWTHEGKGVQNLARTLAEKAAPGEPVVFMHDYYFDLPFYARLRAPVRVLEDWDSPEIARRDNWGKELRDAQQFLAPSAEPVLLPPSALSAIVCSAPVTWVVAYWTMDNRYPELAHAAVTDRSGSAVLWRVTRPAGPNAAPCSAKPLANPPSK